MRYKQQQENILSLQDELLQQVHDSVIVTDLDGKIVYWNNGSSSIFGYTVEEIIGQNIILLCPDKEQVYFEDHLKNMLAGASLQGEFQARRKDGTTIWLDIKTSCLQALDRHERKVHRIVSIGKEITAYRQAEIERQASTSLAQAILDSMDVMMAVLGTDGKIRAVNEAWRRAARGACSSDCLDRTAVGMNYLEVCRQTQGESATEAQEVLAGIEAVIQETQASFNLEYHCDLPTQQRWYMMSVTPLAQNGGAVVAHVDITERKRLEQQKDIFTSIASHELRTPLAVLKGLAQLEKKKWDRQGLSEPVRSLEKMEIQINHLVKLVDELLDVSKIEAGRLDYEEEIINFDRLVREIVEVTQQTIPGHRLLLHGASDATILGDQAKLGQVVTNLLSNAIKYSPQAETVDIFLRSSPDAALISVQDYGIGISFHDLKSIFEPFYRVDTSNHSHIPGLGMGLYITNEIVKRHGGEITVESEKGLGSTFHLSFPLYNAQPETGTESRTQNIANKQR